MGLAHIGLGLLGAAPGRLLRSLGGLEGGPRPLEVRGGDDARVAVGLRPVEVGTGLGEVGGGGGQVGLGRVQAGLHGLGVGPGAAGIDLHEELALVDAVALLDGQAGHLAHDARRDVGFGHRLDPAVGAHLGLEVLPAHGGHLDRDALVAHARDAQAGDHEDRQTSAEDPHLLPLHVKGLPMGLSASQSSLRQSKGLVALDVTNGIVFY